MSRSPSVTFRWDSSSRLTRRKAGLRPYRMYHSPETFTQWEGKADLKGNLHIKCQGALLVKARVPHTGRLLVHLIPDEEQLACTQQPRRLSQRKRVTDSTACPDPMQGPPPLVLACMTGASWQRSQKLAHVA